MLLRWKTIKPPPLKRTSCCGMSRCRVGDSTDVWYGVDLPLLSKRVMGEEGWPLPLLERPGRQIVIISIIITIIIVIVIIIISIIIVIISVIILLIISDIVALLPIITIIRRTFCNKPKKSIWKCLRVIPLFQYWNEKMPTKFAVPSVKTSCCLNGHFSF